MFLLLAPFVTQDYCLPYYWCIPKTLFCENPYFFILVYYFFKKCSCSISKWHEIKVWCDPKDVQVSNFCETGRILKVEPLKLQRQSLSVMLKSWYTELAKPSFLRPELNLSLNVNSEDFCNRTICFIIGENQVRSIQNLAVWEGNFLKLSDWKYNQVWDSSKNFHQNFHGGILQTIIIMCEVVAVSAMVSPTWRSPYGNNHQECISKYHILYHQI